MHTRLHLFMPPARALSPAAGLPHHTHTPMRPCRAAAARRRTLSRSPSRSPRASGPSRAAPSPSARPWSEARAALVYSVYSVPPAFVHRPAHTTVSSISFVFMGRARRCKSGCVSCPGGAAGPRAAAPVQAARGMLKERQHRAAAALALPLPCARRAALRLQVQALCPATRPCAPSSSSSRHWASRVVRRYSVRRPHGAPADCFARQPILAVIRAGLHCFYCFAFQVCCRDDCRGWGAQVVLAASWRCAGAEAGRSRL